MIVELTDRERKYEVVKEVLQALPEWFGIPESLEKYAVDSRDLRVLVYQMEDGKIAGFFTMKDTSQYTGELYVCGIRKEYHKKGIGKLLLNQIEQEFKKTGKKFLQVKTVAPEAKDPDYLKTYAFYKACGFSELEVLPLWDEKNPCLILVKVL